MQQQNYRYKNKCEVCLQFLPKGIIHNCVTPSKLEGLELYHCSKCDKYFPKHMFNKDKAKKNGIMCICKNCRKVFNAMNSARHRYFCTSCNRYHNKYTKIGKDHREFEWK
jgi:hypothetical protein